MQCRQVLLTVILPTGRLGKVAATTTPPRCLGPCEQLGIMCCPAQVQLLQREVELAEATTAAEGSSNAWKLEQARLQEAADQWRVKALELQAEVSSSSSRASASCVCSA